MPLLATYGATSLRNYGFQAGSSVPIVGDFESIATTTVGAGGQSTITFSSIPQTYTHLQLRCFMQLATPGILGIQVGNNSADTSANYSTHVFDGAGAGASSGAGVNETRMGILYPIQAAWTGAVIDFLDYSNINKYKTVRSFMGQDANGSGYVRFAGASWRSTSALNTIVLTPSSGNVNQYSSFALYGINA